MPEMKYKIIRTIQQVDYLIPMFDEKQSKINGWTLPEIIQDWFFGRFTMAGHHATRDSHRVGGGTKVLAAMVIDHENESI